MVFNVTFFLGLVALFLKPTVSQDALQVALEKAMPEQNMSGQTIRMKTPSGAEVEVQRWKDESAEHWKGRVTEAVEVAEDVAEGDDA